MTLVAYDVDAETHPRDAAGFCRASGPDEVGELLAEIRDDPGFPPPASTATPTPSATSAKILRDVFKPGDSWFRTGDLMRRDARGYFYFVDRIGDTFRWKGENVSTTEVAETITTFPGVQEAIVYGVAAPGYEGRAGMAALVVDNIVEFDLEGLRAHVEAALPVYARPLFLRFRTELEATGTFKPKKSALVAEGFDPARVGEPLFFDDRAAARLSPPRCGVCSRPSSPARNRCERQRAPNSSAFDALETLRAGMGRALRPRRAEPLRRARLPAAAAGLRAAEAASPSCSSGPRAGSSALPR